MFGTRVAFEPYDGSCNRRPNQCWRCHGFFHSSEVWHLPMKYLKCAGPHQAKDCTLHFEDPLKCANCGGEHAANCRQCPCFPKSKKAPNHQNKGGNIKNNPKPSNKNINQRNQNTAPEGALGSVTNHPLEKAEVIADSLQKQFEPNNEAENDRFTARTQRKIKRFLDAPTSLDLETTTPGEVQEYIKKLKINKFPGFNYKSHP
ncbi:nucleic-acid-binding protein from transposon X-element [Trichonephila clavipes]|nr:nucleic-acid-binding protein from transposon X-element [Trichonephila clavipes]